MLLLWMTKPSPENLLESYCTIYSRAKLSSGQYSETSKCGHYRECPDFRGEIHVYTALGPNKVSSIEDPEVGSTASLFMVSFPA